MKEDNILIAEFMDEVVFEKRPRHYIGANESMKPYKLADKLKYHTSWDWLMPVVEKINEPEVVDGKIKRSAADVYIYYKACEIEYTPDEDFEDRDEYEAHSQGETKIEAVYKAVVNFIKWYNSQTPHP